MDVSSGEIEELEAVARLEPPPPRTGRRPRSVRPPYPTVILVTGPSDYGSDVHDLDRGAREREAVRLALSGLGAGSVVVQGGDSGADRLSDRLASTMPLFRVTVPYYGPGRGAGGPMRNGLMVRLVRAMQAAYAQPVEVWACGRPGRSSGTDDCVRQAEEAGLPVKWIGGE